MAETEIRQRGGTARTADVSIVVPTYDRAAYLGEALDSLLSQTLAAREIIVIDDGSSDDTAAVVRRYGDRVRYLYQPNGGKSKALNTALPHAAGESIWIFDDDDIADPDALRHLAEALAQHPEAGFAFGDYGLFEDRATGRVLLPSDRRAPDADDVFATTMLEFYVHQPAMLVRADCYRSVGAFAEDLPRAVDLDMLLRLSAVYAAVHVPRILFHQRRHDGIRGPAHHRIRPEQRRRAWRTFSEAIVRRQCERLDERVFLPRRRRHEVGLPAIVDGLLRRSCALARLGLDDLASRDLRLLARYGERLDEATIAALDWSYFARMFVPRFGRRARFVRHAGMRSCRNRTFARAARSALRRPLISMARNALVQRRFRSFFHAVWVWLSLAG